MDVTQIPFNKFVEICYSNQDEEVLNLRFKNNMKNHLGTFHASAQFALAEAASGFSLQRSFSHLANSAVPVLRKADIKFKKLAESDIFAKACIGTEAKEKFLQQFEKKGRAILAVPVEVLDSNDTITMTGTYEWYVQKI